MEFYLIVFVTMLCAWGTQLVIDTVVSPWFGWSFTVTFGIALVQGFLWALLMMYAIDKFGGLS